MLIPTPLNDLTEIIIGKAIVIHDYFGPGMFENIYKRCLGLLLVEAGLIVEVEKPLPVRFRDLSLDCAYRVDLLVEGKVVVEVKTVDEFASVHFAQMITYLKLTDCPIGLILNFNVASMRCGIKRLIYRKALERFTSVPSVPPSEILQVQTRADSVTRAESATCADSGTREGRDEPSEEIERL
jgi:GxxExxY protein